MKPKVYLFLGGWGYIFSMGFVAFGNRLEAMGYEVERWSNSGIDLEAVRASVQAMPESQKVAFFGYSLGANGCVWNAYNIEQSMRHPFIIDLIIGWDPTVNGPELSLYPVGPHVKKCICFHQTTRLMPTSWAFGRGVYVAGKGGPKIEVVNVVADHIAIQFLPALQERAIAELAKL